eukprot:GEMP01062630.1.p1 GENE.GEMP01062630.1~~GEMP01062630.1.p1  ORF type:complete len:309 (+),score=45.61 GEMP01062630.1:56-928(+)
MTRQQSENKANACVTTQFAIKSDDAFSHVFLMVVHWQDMLVFTVISFLPLVLLCLFAYHLLVMLNRPGSTGQVIPPTFYKPPADVRDVEYIIIAVVCVARLLPKMLGLVRAARGACMFFSFWRNSRSYGGRMLLAWFVRIFIDVLVLPLAAMVLGIFVAFYDRTSLLGVIFGITLFGFLLNLDETFVDLYLKVAYPTSYVELIVTDLVFTAKGGESAFWANSEHAKEDVFEALRDANSANTTATWVFAVLTSARTGLGISSNGGTKGKLHIAIRDLRNLKRKPDIGEFLV